MKKYYSTLKYKKHNIIRAKSSHKCKLRFKKYRKEKISPRFIKEKGEIGSVFELKQYEFVKAPIRFSLIDNIEETNNFIHKLKENYKCEKKTFIDLKNVEHLDYSAVTVLLSVMFTFQSKKIRFNGNFPKKRELKKLLFDAEFFKYLEKPVSDKIEYKIGKPNQIFTRGNKEVNSSLGLIIIKEVSETIWGEARRCNGLQTVLIELMQNTHNHAVKKTGDKKHWWLSVNHNHTNNSVKFVFVDFGIGIFESLNSKKGFYAFVEKMKDKLMVGNNAEILKLILDGKIHKTSTNEYFRGKGLPIIKKVLNRNQIDNLVIISNDVYANVSNEDYRLINSNFSGTFFSWELNRLNANMKWIT